MSVGSKGVGIYIAIAAKLFLSVANVGLVVLQLVSVVVRLMTPSFGHPHLRS